MDEFVGCPGPSPVDHRMDVGARQVLRGASAERQQPGDRRPQHAIRRLQSLEILQELITVESFRWSRKGADRVGVEVVRGRGRDDGLVEGEGAGALREEARKLSRRQVAFGGTETHIPVPRPTCGAR